MNAQKYAGAVWPLALVLLTGIYGYWAVQRELVSSRPSVTGEYDVPDPVPPLGIRSLHSRLWQDPLSTAYDHWKALPEEERATDLTSVSDSDELTLNVRDAAHRYETQSDVANDTTPSTKTSEALAKHASEMRKFFRSLVDREDTICMPVLLPGGPYAEDKEKRMRIRYAVVTALAESGYSLKYSTRMSYAVARIHVRVLRGWQECEIIVPVKLYRNRGLPQVLVLWINESELELRPLLAMHRILNTMFSDVTKPQNLDISIIGPSSSDALASMALEIGHIQDAFFPKVIYDANKFHHGRDNEVVKDVEFESTLEQVKLAARQIVLEIRHQPEGEAKKLVEEETGFLLHEVGAIWDATELIDELAHRLKDGQSAKQRRWAKQIKRAAIQIELAEASVVIRRQLSDIKEKARSVIEGEREDGDAKMRDAAVRLVVVVDKTMKEAQQLSLKDLTGERDQGTNGRANSPASRGGSGETANGPSAEKIVDASTVIARGAEKIKRIAAKNKIDGARDIRKAADRVMLLANSLHRIAEDMRGVRRIDKSQHVTVIQRAAAEIKEQAEAADDGKMDVAVVAEQVDRIRVAQAYLLVKQAADRIARNLAAFAGETGKAKTDDAVQVIKVGSFAIIRELSGNITPHKNSNHWYATAYSGTNVRRMQGFMPLLSSLEHGGDAVKLFSPRATNEDIEFSTNNFVDLRRVIGTDRQLIKLLRDELQCRGAASGAIVLITEHDTAYGRQFPKTFQSVFPLNRVHSFKILRGIDGSLPGDAPTRGQANRRESATDLPEIIERPPEGRSQYDYLKRLRHRIEQLEDITAIGVVGNDVYDKLLVLRALKPHFPDCVFFTTDLNAIYSHPVERQHARNLLIASHFDLRLNDRLQQSTAPFRDSYQTSTFLATRLALHHQDPDYWFFDKEQSDHDLTSWASKTNWSAIVDHWFGDGANTRNGGSDKNNKYEFAPTLHVVGRTATQPLNSFDETTIEGKLHPRSSQLAGSWHYFFVGGFTLVAIALAWLLLNRDGVHESHLLNDRSGNIPWIRELVRRLQLGIERAQRILASTGRQQGLVRALDQRLESFHQLLSSRGRILESRVNLGLIVLSGIGCILVLVLCLRGYVSNERSDFIGGYSTWPRKILYGSTGIFAVFAVARVLDQFQIQLKIVGKKRRAIGELASRCFQQVHIAKIALLAMIIVYIGGAFVYELGFVGFFIPALAMVVGLGAAWWHYAERHHGAEDTGGGDVGPPRGNLIIGLDPAPAIGYGLISVIGMAVLAILGESLMEQSHIGWHPKTISRGWLSQFGDWFATAYAFGAVVLLLSTLIYFSNTSAV